MGEDIMGKPISQHQLEMLFNSPEHLYRLLREQPGYVPAMSLVEGDSELLCPGVVSQGCALFVCMQHQERRAFVMLLDSDALAAMRAAIETAQRSVNLSALNELVTTPVRRS
jgi:hypothetical protein